VDLACVSESDDVLAKEVVVVEGLELLMDKDETEGRESSGRRGLGERDRLWSGRWCVEEVGKVKEAREVEDEEEDVEGSTEVAIGAGNKGG